MRGAVSQTGLLKPANNATSFSRSFRQQKRLSYPPSFAVGARGTSTFSPSELLDIPEQLKSPRSSEGDPSTFDSPCSGETNSENGDKQEGISLPCQQPRRASGKRNSTFFSTAVQLVRTVKRLSAISENTAETTANEATQPTRRLSMSMNNLSGISENAVETLSNEADSAEVSDRRRLSTSMNNISAVSDPAETSVGAADSRRTTRKFGMRRSLSSRISRILKKPSPGSFGLARRRQTK